MIINEWRSTFVIGCASFVLKEKLKLLKNRIKSWRNSNMSTDVAKAEKLRSQLATWDSMAANRDLTVRNQKLSLIQGDSTF